MDMEVDLTETWLGCAGHISYRAYTSCLISRASKPGIPGIQPPSNSGTSSVTSLWWNCWVYWVYWVNISRQESPECDHKTNSPQLKGSELSTISKGGADESCLFLFASIDQQKSQGHPIAITVAITGKAAEWAEEGAGCGKSPEVPGAAEWNRQEVVEKLRVDLAQNADAKRNELWPGQCRCQCAWSSW